MTQQPLHCVLFDLDGTLLDTAPDLIACLQEALQQHGYAPVSEAALRPFISFGAQAMIAHSVASTISAERQTDILHTMLALYEANILRHTAFFAGIERILDFIEANNLPWGIVTNKRERFTLPLLTALNLHTRVACVISGDSTANPKPHAEPMLLACEQVGVKPQHCVYIGDAAHDIIAGKQAGMQTLAALYGYLKVTDKPENWGADALISSPYHLLDWLQDRLA